MSFMNVPAPWDAGRDHNRFRLPGSGPEVSPREMMQNAITDFVTANSQLFDDATLIGRHEAEVDDNRNYRTVTFGCVGGPGFEVRIYSETFMLLFTTNRQGPITHNALNDLFASIMLLAKGD